MDADLKYALISISCILTLIVGITLLLGLLLSWAVESGRNERSPKIHAECEAKGGKIMITYNSSYSIEKVTCVPAGVNLIEMK